MTDRRDYAAKAAYDRYHALGHIAEDGPAKNWEDLTEDEKGRWRLAADAAVGASPAPFFVDCSIKLPDQSEFGMNVHFHLFFGVTDEEIEAAGVRFVTRMKNYRDDWKERG